mmetsp:Transcript_27558/g.27242  ORF Transcript_27558/g.27242 Transcript_27558/m.27242 type:complete len:194 (+) Transcript_27558:94-675(+)
MNYLVLEGYKTAAEQFRTESGTEPGVELSTLEDRMKIRNAIMKGQIEEAIDMINVSNPSLLQQNQSLFFNLRLQRLIEYIKENRISEALGYGQEVLAPAAQGNKEYLGELEKAMSLLAFNDLSASPVSHLASISRLQQIASEVNAAILTSHGQPPNSKLQVFMKLLSWTQRKLENTVEFPVIRDLAAARLELP